MRLIAIVAVLATLAVDVQAHAAGPLELNVYGLSHHWDRTEAHRLGTDKEVNPGLGLRYELAGRELCSTPFVESGIYRDSGAHASYYAGLGCKGLRLSDNIRLGIGLSLMQSDTYNGGKPFVAPVPILTWRIAPVTLNFIQYPEIKSLGIINTTGLYISLPLP